MTLKTASELENTREKLRELESRYDELRNDRQEDARVRDMTMRSLRKLINQLKEEIALFQAHHTAPR